MHAFFAILAWAAMLVLFSSTGYSALAALSGGPDAGFWGIVLGFSFWLIALAYLLPFFLASVPVINGLIILNLFTQRIRAVGQGLSWKYPWEKKAEYFHLRIVTVTFEIVLPAKDGVPLKIKCAYTYEPDLLNLTQYVKVDETTINDGFTAALSGILTELTGKGNAETIRKRTDELRAKALALFEGNAQGGQSGAGSCRDPMVTCQDLEKEYGIDVKFTTIADIDYDEDYQKTLTTRKRMEVLRSAALKAMKVTYKDPVTGETVLARTSYKDAYNSALVVDGSATKNIQEVEGEGLAALSGVFVGGLRGAAEAIKGKDDHNGKKGGA